MKLLKQFVPSVLMCASLLYAQEPPPTRVALSNASNIPAEEIVRLFGKECSYITVGADLAAAPYVLQATKTITRSGLRIERVAQFDLTVSDQEGILVGEVSGTSLKSAVKEICHVVKTSVMVEIVSAQNLKLDRETHTEVSAIHVVVNGEHALLDCFERNVPCATITPGKYYAVRQGDGVWVTYRMPITHQVTRSHYKVSGSW